MAYPTIRSGRRDREHKYFLWGTYPGRPNDIPLGWFKSQQEADRIVLSLRNRQPLAVFRVEFHPFGVPYSLMEDARRAATSQL